MRTLFFALGISLSLHISAQQLTFGAIADAQYCDCPADSGRNRYYVNAKDKLADAIDTMNLYSPAFVVHLGDFIDRNWSSYDTMLPIWRGLHMPGYFVLGNHEFDVADSLKYKVPVKLGMESKYYDFAYGKWRFLVLDENDLSVNAYPKDSPEYYESETMLRKLQEKGLPQAKRWNGGISHEQQDWIIRKLEASMKAKENVIVFGHMPLLKSGHTTVWNNTEIIRIFEKYYCVKAYICGHDHKGSYGFRNGIHYINLKGMLDFPEQSSFSIITLSDDGISIRGFGREENLDLKISGY
jgi:predicted phosphodiesterase